MTHNVALAIISPCPIHPDGCLRAQCECGWSTNYESPITLARVNKIVAEHLSAPGQVGGIGYDEAQHRSAWWAEPADGAS